jgi:RNA polymerase sigma-70 factor (ECF subfamily)
MLELLDAPVDSPPSSAPDPEPDDASLLRRHELPSFEVLVRRHQSGLIRFLEGLLGNRADAEDVAQEALIAAFRESSAFEGRASVRSWLFAIAKNAALGFKRSTARRRRRDRTARPAAGSAGDPSEAWALELLAKIPEPFREALLLCDLAGFTYEEAAETLKSPVKTISTRLFRGRERLAALLEERDLGHGP